jgi:tetratricopeptide (TPR) repeat protein
VVLLLVFAFLTASFRASNTDLFLHLATGRLIAGGAYEFGADPFTFTADGGKWINHSWLVDLVAFYLYRIGEVGGILLVVLKAALVVLLAWLMLKTGSPSGRPQWIPLVCTVLGILVASPRLQLQPAVLSFVLLAATLFLLVRVGTKSRWIWLLPVLCLVWVNVDEWFLLGPVTIALYLIGELIQQRQAAPDQAAEDRANASPRILVLVLVASLAACVANPYHVQAFVLPSAIDPSLASSVMAREFRGMFLSPFQGDYFLRHIGLNAAGIAYFPLLLLGAISFILAFPAGKEQAGTGWRWWRVLVWLAFALLSAWNLRTIPFFAVVAGPITALNFLDFAERTFGKQVAATPGWRRWALSGRALTVIALLVLGGTGVLGLLQAQPLSTSTNRYQARGLGWGIDVDPALHDAALQAAEWHKDGLLSGHERWLNLSPDVVNCFAWYCADDHGLPLVHGFIDHRLTLFTGVAEDYATVRRSLSGDDLPGDRSPGKEPPSPAWRKVLRDRKVQFVVSHPANLDRTRPILERLHDNPDEWQPRYMKGRTTVFAWRDPTPGRSAPFDARLEIDFDALAFGPHALRAPDKEAPAPQAPPWWRALLHQEAPETVDAGTALQYIWRFGSLTRRYAVNNEAAIQSAVVGAAAGRGGPVVNGTLTLLRFHRRTAAASPGGRRGRPSMDQVLQLWINEFLAKQDDGPPSSLYLALRAARQAIHDNPEDARSWLVLAEVCNRLSKHTRERSLVPFQWYHPYVIRQSQITGALKSVLNLNPSPEMARTAHFLLAQTLRGPEYREAQIGHLREYWRLSKEMGSMIGVPEKDFPKRLAALKKSLDSAERELDRRRDQYLLNSSNKPLVQRAQIAMASGLAETALNLLQKAELPDLMDQRNPGGMTGAMIAINLMLGLGRLHDTREVLAPPTDGTPVNKMGFGMHALGLPAYLWGEVQLAAALGDYEGADKALGECLDWNQQNQGLSPTLVRLGILPLSQQTKEMSLGAFAALTLGDALMHNTPRAGGIPGHVLSRLNGRTTAAMSGQVVSQALQKQADLWTLRAWLALEHGRTDRAETYARKALKLSEVGRRSMLFRSRGLAVLCLDLVSRGRR